MKTVSLQEATRDLDALARAVEQGEVVTVTRDGKPVLDLVPHAGTGEAAHKKGGIDWEAMQAHLRQLVSRMQSPISRMISMIRFLKIFS